MRERRWQFLDRILRDSGSMHLNKSRSDQIGYTPLSSLCSTASTVSLRSSKAHSKCNQMQCLSCNRSQHRV